MSARSFIGECRAYLAARTLESARLVRAVWKVEYALGWQYAHTRVASDSPVLREFVLIECEGIGSCHQEVVGPSLLDHDCIGRDALGLLDFPLSYQIAALDAVAARLLPTPDDETKLLGSGAERLAVRSDIIVGEVRRVVARQCGSSHPVNVVVIGALDSVIRGLLRIDGIRVRAADANPAVVGRRFHGVVINSANETLRLVEQSDVAVVTGMVIATETYDDVIAAAKSSGSHIVMFSQTGANLIEPMRATGVNVIISESYPFCFTGVGETWLRVYRSPAGQ